MGSGYRVFTAGEVLTASNVQDYLMDQSVMSFADSTARATSIGTANFEEGMVSYLQDTNQLEVYDGSAWASIAPTSTQGLTLINSTSFSAVASQSVNDVFSATYDNYRILVNCIGSTAINVGIRLRVAGSDTATSTYQQQFLFASSTTVSSDRTTTDTSNSIGDCTSTDRLMGTLDCFGPFLVRPTGFSMYAMGRYPTTNNISIKSASQSGSTSFTGFTLLPNTGNITGTVSVYGYNI